MTLKLYALKKNTSGKQTFGRFDVIGLMLSTTCRNLLRNRIGVNTNPWSLPSHLICYFISKREENLVRFCIEMR